MLIMKFRRSNRVQIRSGGQELEDIQEYGRLYAMLMAVQSSRLTADEYSLTQNDGFQGAATSFDGVTKNAAFFQPAGDTAGDVGTKLAATIGLDGTAGGAANSVVAALKTAIDNTRDQKYLQHNTATQVTDGNQVTFNVPIISAFFNIDKYFPLLLTDQGLELYFYLNPAVDIGVWGGDPGDEQYTITDLELCNPRSIYGRPHVMCCIRARLLQHRLHSTVTIASSAECHEQAMSLARW
eukprot:SAG25_NODE_220_length_11624_cov_41.246508_1_plen_239_part_00